MKSLEEFVSLFAEQFEETNVSEFAPQTKFHELEEWSSLMALSIIAMVDEEFDVTIKGNDIKDSETIENLYQLISEKL